MQAKLDLLAATLAGYIDASEELAATATAPAITAITEQKGDINTTVATALQKLGLAVVVIVGDIRPGDTGNAKSWSQARLIVEVCETYALNKTGRRCLPVAEAIARVAHGKDNGLGRQAGLLKQFHLEPGQNLRLVPDATKVIRHVTFLTDFIL